MLEGLVEAAIDVSLSTTELPDFIPGQRPSDARSGGDGQGAVCGVSEPGLSDRMSRLGSAKRTFAEKLCQLSANRQFEQFVRRS